MSKIKLSTDKRKANGEWSREEDMLTPGGISLEPWILKPEGLPCSLSELVLSPGHDVQMVMVSWQKGTVKIVLEEKKKTFFSLKYIFILKF